MCRKRRHDCDNEEGRPSSPLKRPKYHTNVAPTKLARRAIGKSIGNPLIALRCFICTSTSNEDLLPLEEQPRNPVPKCRQNGGIWMAHRTCAQLLNGVCVFKPSNSEEEVVEGLQRIEPRRFKLKCVACTHVALKVHGAKVQCSNSTCTVAYHPICAKTTNGVSLIEVKTIKTTEDDGVRETVEYEFWCKMHNSDIHAARRATKAAGRNKLFAELETVKPVEGNVVQNDVEGRKVLISDGEDSEWFRWDCIAEVISGKGSNRTGPLEELEQVDDDDPRTEPNLQTSAAFQENIVQSGVRESVSSASGLADPPSNTPPVFETPDPAPWPLTTPVYQTPPQIVVEMGIRKPATATPTSKGDLEATTPTSVPTPASALEPPLSPAEALASLRCFICVSSSVEYLLPLRHQPRWDLGACRHPQTYGTWEAHRECALLIDETIVCETPGRLRGQVEGVRSIDPERFKLICVGCTQMDYNSHGAKIKCQNSTCVVAYHPGCAKQAEGIVFHEGPISEVESQGMVGKTRSYTLWCETHDPYKPPTKGPIETSSRPPKPQNFKPGMVIMVKHRSRDKEGVIKTIISNDAEGRRVECQETTGTHWYSWSQVLGIPSENEDPSGSKARVGDQQIREQISTSHDMHDIQPEPTDSDRSVIPETPQDLDDSNQIDNTCLQSRSQTPDALLQEVSSQMAKFLTSTSQVMHERPISQNTAPLSPFMISTPNQALVDVDEQFNDVEDEAQAANDADSIVEFVMTPESETDEEEQSLLVPRFERSETQPVPQKPSISIQCGTPPKQYADICVQANDTAPRALSLDSCRDACYDLLLQKVVQKTEWKDDLDRMLMEMRYDLWRKRRVKDITE